MLKMRPYAPPDRIAIRDSIDEEVSDDIEDDVFIRDGKSGKNNEEQGLKRPLMAPRRKNSKTPNPVPIMKKHRRCWKCCEPFCYGLAAVTILIALIFLAAMVLTMFPIPLQRIKGWLRRDTPLASSLRAYEVIETEQVPCSQISVQRVWSKAFPRINSESPVRKADLNGDGVDDIVFGYGIDESIPNENYVKCMSHRLEMEVACEGGIIALHGVSGEVLWQRWALANVFSLYCNVDINQDGHNDCVAAGRRGLIFAVNGQSGEVLWEFKELEVETNSPILIDLYTINTIRDLDGDGIQDILTVHVEERETSRAGHIKLISGSTGSVIRSIPTPFREEVFVPLQVLTKQDGTELLLIITGGQNTPGGLYTIRLHSLMQYTSDKEFVPLHQSEFTGFMVPAILTDINEDSVEDIIVSAFNSTVYAFDGKNSSILWTYLFPTSESVSSIVPGHFDNDNITDFMVKFNTGPGFPVYYYSQTTILNGATGQPLLDSTMTDSGGPNSLLGGVSVSQTFGGDFFLHWQTQCRGKYDIKDAYQFMPDSDIVLQSRADTCLLRYNTSTVLKLYAIARHVEPPGAVIFSSDDLNLRLNRTKNVRFQKMSISPIKHPKMLKKIMSKVTPSIDRQSQQSTLLRTSDKKRKEKPSKFRRPVIDRKLESSPLQSEQERPYEAAKPYLYMPYSNQPGREFKEDYEPETNQEEYDVLYGDEHRPIRLRNKYPISRDVRSDAKDQELQDTSNETKSPNQLPSNQPYNLWNLELEKEEEDAIKESQKIEYSSRQTREADDKDNFLSSISSTGVLTESLDKTASSIDLVFVLNVRESELYPPLFLPEDMHCVEEKMSGYGSYTNEDIIALEKEYLKQCLGSRISNIEPDVPRYESQLIITRISITCSCGSLEKDEHCSRIEKIEKQKWTEFMGNTGNGLYPK